MKPVKVTAELLLTPEMFSKWCDGSFPETETSYKLFVKSQVYFKFRTEKELGDYEDFINTTIEDNGNGLKLTITEVQ